jgi:hypothetical protein
MNIGFHKLLLVRIVTCRRFGIINLTKSENALKDFETCLSYHHLKEAPRERRPRSHRVPGTWTSFFVSAPCKQVACSWDARPIYRRAPVAPSPASCSHEFLATSNICMGWLQVHAIYYLINYSLSFATIIANSLQLFNVQYSHFLIQFNVLLCFNTLLSSKLLLFLLDLHWQN